MVNHPLVQRGPTLRVFPKAPVAYEDHSQPTRQDCALVVCGGGDPFAELERAKELCAAAGRNYTIFAGNDMIEHCPEDIGHAVTLHPDKLARWLPARRAAGRNVPERIWAHRNYNGAVTHWTRDWAGSTGLFAIKIARELGFVHVIGCGVHMQAQSGHFVRKADWTAATGFLRGWTSHMEELKPYVRTFYGWTCEKLGEPTVDWLQSDIIDHHRPNQPTAGLRA